MEDAGMSEIYQQGKLGIVANVKNMKNMTK
jgi:hypothetical protein